MIKTTVNKGVLFTFLGLIIAFLFLALVIAYSSASQVYSEGVEFYIFLSFNGFALYCLYKIWTLNKYEFEGETLTIKSLFNTTRKTFNRNDIVRYIEVTNRSKNSTWKEATFFTENDKFKIISSVTNDYDPLKRALVFDGNNAIYRDLHAQDIWYWKKKITSGIICSFIASVLIVFSVFIFFLESSIALDSLIVCAIIFGFGLILFGFGIYQLTRPKPIDRYKKKTKY